MSLLQTLFQNWIIGVILLTSIPAIGQFHVKPFDISKNITALHTTDEGYLLYGTDTGEIGQYDGLQFNRIENLKAKIRNIEMQNETLHLFTDKGLFECKDGKCKLLSRNNLNILAKSKDNSFLVTTSGVYNAINSEYIPNKEDFFDINEITYGAYFEIGELDCFRKDEKVYFKNKRWKEVISHSEDDFNLLPLNSKQMLVCDRKALITFDQEGYVDTLLRLNTEKRNKIFKLDGSKLLLCSNDSIGVFDLRKRAYNTFYRVPTDLISGVTVDNWGNYWLSAGSYLYQIIDRSNKKRNSPPQIAIESIRINGVNHDIKSSYRLEKENEIEIDYQGVHLTLPQNLEFQTLLSAKYHSLGYSSSDEGEWSKSTKDRNIEYRNLEPGKYTFQLRGSVDGEYFMYTKPIVFSVQSDLFQSVWIIGILVGIGILLLALFFNSRYNSLKAKSKQDRDKLVQENRMLTLQQTALQLQMNPHFVFNSLNSIQGLIANNDNQKARRYLQEFSAMMRSVLNQSREETILLTDEVNYLRSYLNLEQMANNNKFDWSIDVDESLDDDIRIPTMIIQPFVENSILHGVKNLNERRGNIVLSFELSGTNVLCKIIDNGIGRKASGAKKSNGHKSVALDVVAERLSTKLSSSRKRPIQYNDITNEDGYALGTEVEVTIPIMN